MKKWIFYYVAFLVIFLFYVISVLTELINGYKIKKKYNNIIYNWNLNPIKSIELKDRFYFLLGKNRSEKYELARIKTNKDKYSFYIWKNKFFKVEKLTDYDYNNIYTNENGKLCGQDSNGNNLYFPENIDCPINAIAFSDTNFNFNYPGIKKLEIDD